MATKMEDTGTNMGQSLGAATDAEFLDFERSNTSGRPENRKRTESQDSCDPETINKPNDSLPPIKRIKSEDLTQILDKCYDLKYQIGHHGPSSKELNEGLEFIRDAILSGSASFGSTRMEIKTNWGKCLALMLDDIPDGIKALEILTRKLGTGGGML